MNVIKSFLIAGFCFVFAAPIEGVVVTKKDALAMNSFIASKVTPRSMFVFRMNRVLDNAVLSANLRVRGRACARVQPAVDLSVRVK